MTSPSEPSPSHAGSGRRRGSTSTWIVVGVFLAIPIVLPLLVPIYGRESPRLADVPFFFWFQFALIPVAAICTTIAFRIVVSIEGKPDEVEAHSAQDPSGGRP